MRDINVLSCFDGASCGQLALSKLGVSVGAYYASEIDKYAIQVTQANFPNTIQVGDITKVNIYKFNHHIDLMMGGSPCQGFSFAGHQLNLMTHVPSYSLTSYVYVMYYYLCMYY